MTLPARNVDISVVIPVYNSEGSLQLLLEEIEKTLSPLGAFEVVLVNDGSKDTSWKKLLALSESRPWMVCINLMRNYGQHTALLVGIQNTSGKVLVTLDDDLQTPPSEIPKLLNALTPDVDVVYGTRSQEQHGMLRNSASRLTKHFIKYCLNVNVAPEITSFRAFRSELRQNFTSLQRRPVFIDALLAGATQYFASTPVRHDSRTIGASNYTWSRLFRHGADIITAFSVVPLQLASLLGFLFVAFGGVLLAYILISYLLGRVNVPGFTFLAAVICLFSGSQMIVLGIFGTYLARVHQNVSDVGQICVRETRKGGKAVPE